MRSAGFLAVALSLAACATGSSGDAVETVAALNGRLLANPSATATLEGWCAERRLAAQPRIVARRGAADKPATAEIRESLQATADEPVRYRQVKLVCGTYVLEHRAVLSTAAGVPFSLVVERYTSDVLAKPPAP